MSVQSRDLRSTKRRFDWPVWMGMLGTWLAIITFGGVFWVINGGFSVLGLEVVSKSFNEVGIAYWELMAAYTFSLPITIPGVASSQPFIPWLGVIAASTLQITVIYLRLRGEPVLSWMWGSVIALSCYDFLTTFFGMGTVKWLAVIPWPARGALALVLTFLVEASVGYMMREAMHDPARHRNSSQVY